MIVFVGSVIFDSFDGPLTNKHAKVLFDFHSKFRYER